MSDRIDANPGSSQAGPLSAASAERLDRLFRLYNSRLLAFARLKTRDHATAEDVVSETWLRAALSLPQLQADDSRAYGWLRAIAFRAAVDQYRPKRASEKPKDWTDALSSLVLPVTPSADEDALCLASLTARQATVVKLAAQGLTQRAIAARIDRSETAVWKRLHGGARKLRAVVGDDPIRTPAGPPKPGTVMSTRPPLPMRPTPHERDGRQPAPQPARPHSRAAVPALAG